MSKTTIILIRHGETDWNKKNVFRGLKDIPLNENGLRQAHKTTAALQKVPVKAVYSSPLSRAFETATIIAKAKGLEPVIEEPFNDISFGLWEGRLVDEVAREYPEEFKRWVDAPHLWKAPEGDSLTAVKERAWSRLEELSREHEKETLVVVSHRVVLMLLLIAALGMDDSKFWNLEQSPCAINVLTKKDGRYLLSKFNESCHLVRFSEAISSEAH
ncbi:MAG TPA: histidine phosphatase family protein [Bacillota bacterium]|jgi:broad specificity phosphatase PhoE|nr:histidine phosphatase family protein [Bacillota bacterium]HOB29655.1 histidine phosphatase family protein [Bacillota bacterium]HPZ42264.1 histidine phosphatase family protein [Bacillota bacterium]HQD53075.1 histidine phosphatase family protein [Bacillota bacterium]